MISKLSSAAAFALAVLAVGVAAKAETVITPGTLIIHGTPFGAFSEVVVDVKGDSALSIMFGKGHWSKVSSLTSQYSSGSVYTPKTNPYESVLVPVMDESEKVVGMKELKAEFFVVDRLGRKYVITGEGKVLGVGEHVNRDVIAVEGYSRRLQDNIAVNKGETVLQAINRYNNATVEYPGYRMIDPNVEIDSSSFDKRFNLKALRTQADLEIEPSRKSAPADRAAMRAVDATRGAGETVKVDAVVRESRRAK